MFSSVNSVDWQGTQRDDQQFLGLNVFRHQGRKAIKELAPSGIAPWARGVKLPDTEPSGIDHSATRGERRGSSAGPSEWRLPGWRVDVSLGLVLPVRYWWQLSFGRRRDRGVLWLTSNEAAVVVGVPDTRKSASGRSRRSSAEPERLNPVWRS